MREMPKPPALAGRGGCWFHSGGAVLHLGVEEPFRPAVKAHPAFPVDHVHALAGRLAGAGYALSWANDEIPGVHRFHTADPLGNRVELQSGRVS